MPENPMKQGTKVRLKKWEPLQSTGRCGGATIVLEEGMEASVMHYNWQRQTYGVKIQLQPKIHIVLEISEKDLEELHVTQYTPTGAV